MPVHEPGWWYGGPSWQARLLGPAARVWGWTAKRRLTRIAPVQASLPVICVGNFTAGGTGKTPLSVRIAALLQDLGERPAFLTRGYGGRVRGPHRVDLSLDTASDVGDEPLLLARRAPVFVARDRVAGAALAARDMGLAPPTVIVMDDGLQNPSLTKDLTIAVVDGRRGVGNGCIIPAGPLRAPLELQLGLADAIVVNVPPGTAADSPSAIADWFRQRFDGPVLEASVEPEGDQAHLSGARVVALAGIANPARFYAMLGELGAEIVVREEFADHHAFSELEAKRVIAHAERLDALIVTTEKDWVRLIGRSGALAELRDRAAVLPIRAKLNERDDVRLRSLVETALLRRRKSL